MATKSGSRAKNWAKTTPTTKKAVGGHEGMPKEGGGGMKGMSRMTGGEPNKPPKK